MKFLLATISAVFLFASCSSTSKDGLSIKGKIKDEAPGTKVYLEEVTYSSRTDMDTAELDAQGDFTINTQLKNLGLYQLRVGDQHAIFLVLDEKPASVTLNADSSTIKTFTYEVKGSAPSEQLRKFIAQTKQYGEAFGHAMNDYSRNVNDSTSDSIRVIYTQKVMQADSTFRSFARAYIDTVKNPVIAMFAVTNLDIKNDLATFEKVESNIRAGYANLPFAQAYLAMMDAQHKSKQEDLYAPKFKVGDVAPDIALNNPIGNQVKLSSLKGQYVLLDFWASWCGPCRHENPNVVAAYEKYKSKGFTVFSVSLDTDHDKWVNAIKKDHLAWNNHVSELKGWQSAICAEYGISAIPQNFLLDKDGKILAVNLRGEQLDQKLAEVMP